MERTPLYYMLALLLSLFSCNQAEEESPQIDIAAPVTVQDVALGSLTKYTTTTGNALAEKVIELSSQIGGKYQLNDHPKLKRPYKLGDAVKKGQLFVSIEDKEYENGIGLETIKMNLELAEQEYEKQKSVYEKGGVTLSQLRNSEITLAKNKNDLENAELKLEKLKVFLPISGIIVDLPQYTSGSRIDQSKPLATIMDYSKMYVDVSLPENTITEIKKGLKVQITNYSLPNDTLVGTVSELSPAIDVKTRTYIGKLRFSNPKLLIRPGMFVKALIKTEERKDIIVVPKEVILSDQRGKRVFIVEENTAFERMIQTGMESDEEVEVLSGLEVNDRLVIKGFETLRNKSKVKVLR